MPNAIPFSGLASGVHDFTTTDGKNIEVFYDMDTKDGPWIVIQRRTSDDVVFHRNWTDYKNGFGDLLGNFWIERLKFHFSVSKGNDNLHLLTTTSMILRVELEAWDGTKGYAQYSEFQVANEAQNYRLSVRGFSGNVSYDALSFHDGYDFTSFDRDNDIHEGGNCAQGYHGSWWFSDCFTCNLNGLYVTDNGEVNTTAIIWRNFPDQMSLATPLKKSKMMIR
ncbi:ficolin-2-like [Pecten maximus]|uniref:ficolin-2-like n=1 Tax=Pecten maximus TaxID=6579 RepID=UPI0014588D68|nr:ficolin-2-like [Pecten maximus]